MNKSEYPIRCPCCWSELKLTVDREPPMTFALSEESRASSWPNAAPGYAAGCKAGEAKGYAEAVKRAYSAAGKAYAARDDKLAELLRDFADELSEASQ